MKKTHPLLLSLLSGILLSAAWPVSPLTPLIFIAWVPLLLLLHRHPDGKKFFGYIYLCMVTWNILTTWWVWNASAPGAVGAILANSLLMSLPWLAARSVKRRLGDKAGLAAVLLFWLAFEYFHLQNWGLSWPWLTLGNVFASHPGWVQWYAYTGTSGGGLWILTVNILVFRLVRQSQDRRPTIKSFIPLTASLLLPFLLSVLLTPPPQDKEPINNIVIVQPNIDPNEKLSTGSFDAMLHKLIRISDQGIDSKTRLVVWPETALYNETGIDEATMKGNYFLNPLWDFLRRHPKVTLLTGIESFRFFKGRQTKTAHNIPGTNTWSDSYNAGVLLDSAGPIVFYHKTRLVPGVETLPGFLHILDAWFEKFGGTTGGYAGQDERTVMVTPDSLYHIAPAVCYESIYGEFMSEYVRNGADIIAVFTNDGWWGDTPGYQQHLSYARLRAIETRRWVVRSANTGVSAVIDPAGRLIKTRPWWQEAYIRANVPTEKEQTFYTRFGDLLSKLISAASIILFAWLIVVIIKKRRHA